MNFLKKNKDENKIQNEFKFNFLNFKDKNENIFKNDSNNHKNKFNWIFNKEYNENEYCNTNKKDFSFSEKDSIKLFSPSSLNEINPGKYNKEIKDNIKQLNNKKKEQSFSDDDISNENETNKNHLSNIFNENVETSFTNFNSYKNIGSILCKYEIYNLNEKIQILGNDEFDTNINELKEKLFIDNINTDFNCYQFKKNGINILKFNQMALFKNINGLFYNCSSLKSINLSKFISNNIESMKYLFHNCYSLESIVLTNFNTLNVKDMSYMFNFCYSLKEINLFSFNTKNVKNMSSMFSNCYSLKKLNLSNFNT